MSDELDRYINDINEAFAIAKKRAEQAATAHNSRLKLTCEYCDEATYVPGLKCWRCGWQATIPDGAWFVVRDDEWGYSLLPIGTRKPYATYHVDLSE
jgi:hypothetical protein